MTTVYRIKHLITGLYFCPSRLIKAKLTDRATGKIVNCRIKSNLSKNGKTYLRKPTIKQIGSQYYTHLITSVGHLSRRDCLLPVIPTEWDIEEIN